MNEDLPLSLKSTFKTICISFILEIQDFLENFLGLFIQNYHSKKKKNKNYRFSNNPNKAVPKSKYLKELVIFVFWLNFKKVEANFIFIRFS